MKVLIKSLIFLVFIFSSLVSFPQTSLYKHYGVEDGLSSSEVYSTFQDSKGYIWFATDGGVSKFNGYEFENFSVSDGLTDNTVFLFDEDEKGRIWFGTFNCQLSYYDEGKIYSYKYNDSLKVISNLNSVIQSFKVDDDENVWLGFTGKGLYRINEIGNVELISKTNEKTQVEIVCFNDSSIAYARKGGERLKEAISTKMEYIDTTQVTILTNKQKSIIYTFMELYKPNVSNNCVITRCNKNRIIYLYSPDNSFLLDLNDGQKISLKGLSFLKTQIYSANFFNEHLWLCVENDGVYKCKIEGASISLVDNYLKGIQVSRVYKDNRGGTWYATIGEGVYYSPTSNISPFLFNGENVVSIQMDTINNIVYSYMRDGNIYQINNGMIKNILKESSGYFPLYYDYTSQQLFIGHTMRGNILSYKNGKKNNVKVSPYNSSFKSILIDGDTIYKTNHYGFSVLVNNKETYFSYLDDKTKLWCTSLLKDKNKIWIGTNDGVVLYDSGKLSMPYKNHKYLSDPITCMEKLDDNTFIVGTKTKGLLIVYRNKVINILNESAGLSSNLIRNIHVDNNKRIWVTTGKGLCEYDIDVNKIYDLTKKYGLQKLVINQIISNKNMLYLATNYGILQLDKNLIEYTQKEKPLFLTSIKVNYKEKEWSENLMLNHYENNIEVNYEFLDYKSQGNSIYQYRLLGVKDSTEIEWVNTTNRRINFISLSSGNYILNIRAKGADGYWSNTLKLVFIIEKPIWLKWWFISIEVFVLLILIYMVVLYRGHKLRKEDKINREIIELKLKALKAQINPHFIFNTLNSIQHFVQEKDFYKTNKYISKFSKLIRNVLELSEKVLITIDEEINTLELYLEVESMRFDGGFDYEIRVDKGINRSSAKIPSMIIQPYVENAIWHGLMNTERKGNVILEFFKKEGSITCKITDNGIGRKKARLHKMGKEKTHKSLGMNITKRRLSLLYGELNPASVSVKDVVENNKVLGTEVVIKFPRNLR